MRRSAFLTQIAFRMALVAWTNGLTSPIANADPQSDSPDIIVVSWFDHFTFGAVNTLIGAGWLTARVIKKKVAGEPVHVGLDMTGKTIKLVDSVSTGSNEDRTLAHNIGAFEFSLDEGDDRMKTAVDGHESAHGLQSGILGPTSHLLTGLANVIGMEYGMQPKENWASAWGLYLNSSLREGTAFTTQLGLGKGRKTYSARATLRERGSRLDVVGATKSLLDYARGNEPFYNGLPEVTPQDTVQVFYRYGNLGSEVSVDCQGSTDSLKLEAGLFQKDFLAEWKSVIPALTLLVDSKQEVGSFEIDVVNKTIDAKLLKHVLGYGLRAGSRDKLLST